MSGRRPPKQGKVPKPASSNQHVSNTGEQPKQVKAPKGNAFAPPPNTPITAEKDVDNELCIVCYRRYPETKYFSIGSCDHPVCYECSTRMRVLMDQNECATCRQSLDKVVFTHQVKPYKELQSRMRMFILIPKYGILIEDEEIHRAYDELQQFPCLFCDGPSTFANFKALRTHVQREHELFPCELCTEHIKHFPKERKFYTRPDLAYHKRKGDKNDSSHRGHPLCQFCDVRFFDPDHLFTHLRRDHYFCHFCDADGYNHYYNAYDDLRMHFRKEHFLCEEENCAEEKFTSVFRTDIDLKAHLTSAHSRLLGKQGTKQARHLDVEFGMRSSEDDRRGRFGRTEHRYHRARDRDYDRDRDRGEEVHVQEEPSPTIEPGALANPSVQPKMDSALDFPLLGEMAGLPRNSPTSGHQASNGPPSSRPSPGQQQPTQSISSRIAPTWNAKTKLEDDFPLLAGTTDPAGTASMVPKVFMRQKPPQPGPAPKSATEDFPALPNQVKKVWSGAGPRKESAKGASKKPVPAPALPGPEFNYVPLLKTNHSQQNGVKAVEPSPPPSPQPVRHHAPPPDPEVGSKKKKKQIALAAAALFNGGGLPPKNNTTAVAGTSTEKKPDRRPRNNEEDFPTLPVSSGKGAARPPASRPLARPKAPPPPRKISPPPGFSLISPVRTGNGSGLPNGPPPGFDPIPKYIGMYAQPSSYALRTSILVEGITRSLNSDPSSLEIYNSITAQFKREEIDGKEYYEMCQDMFGIGDFRVIFTELVVLLSDIGQQQALLQAHRQAGGGMSNLSMCHECGQVLKPADVTFHMKSHSESDPFPTLLT